MADKYLSVSLSESDFQDFLDALWQAALVAERDGRTADASRFVMLRLRGSGQIAEQGGF